MAKGTIQAQVNRTKWGFIVFMVVVGLAYWFISGGAEAAGEVETNLNTLKQTEAERGQY